MPYTNRPQLPRADTAGKPATRGAGPAAAALQVGETVPAVATAAAAEATPAGGGAMAGVAAVGGACGDDDGGGEVGGSSHCRSSPVQSRSVSASRRHRAETNLARSSSLTGRCAKITTISSSGSAALGSRRSRGGQQTDMAVNRFAGVDGAGCPNEGRRRRVDARSLSTLHPRAGVDAR